MKPHKSKIVVIRRKVDGLFHRDGGDVDEWVPNPLDAGDRIGLLHPLANFEPDQFEVVTFDVIATEEGNS